MRILAVDNEALALRDLLQAIEAAVPGADLLGFEHPAQAIAAAKAGGVDVAFLDVEMEEMNGISLAMALKEVHPQINIVFVTGYADYMGNAFSIHASGYVIKPVRPEHIIKELENLRHPVDARAKNAVWVKCFGSFEVFVHGTPLLFSRSKAKELLAYLVHQRGSGVATAKIASVLWEEKQYTRSLQKQTQTVITQMQHALREAGIGDMVIKGWNNLAVDTGKFRCDYYDFLQGDVSALNAYAGEYMSDYSWAEDTTGLLTYQKTKQ